LDWHRHRFLFRPEQSGRNYDGRAHYRDGYFYSEFHANSNPWSKSDCNSDANGDSDGYGYTDGNGDTYTSSRDG